MAPMTVVVAVVDPLFTLTSTLAGRESGGVRMLICVGLM
jgi:hypothetical protein